MWLCSPGPALPVRVMQEAPAPSPPPLDALAIVWEPLGPVGPPTFTNSRSPGAALGPRGLILVSAALAPCVEIGGGARRPQVHPIAAAASQSVNRADLAAPRRRAIARMAPAGQRMRLSP
jgi:hypothetical protein